ncbi:GNAT family N-acetyltransferase, partial [Vibrio alginolyticus]
SLTRIEIVCDPDNNASQALIESVGAKKEAIARNRFIFHGKPKDGVVYSLLPTDLL